MKITDVIEGIRTMFKKFIERMNRFIEDIRKFFKNKKSQGYIYKKSPYIQYNRKKELRQYNKTLSTKKPTMSNKIPRKARSNLNKRR